VKPGRLSGHFLEGERGPLFALVREPIEHCSGCVLVVPPFAEEMNKCRRMVTLVSQQLAERGIATVIPDLYGTGDSAGVLDDADWATWIRDIRACVGWIERRGMRIECLLAIRLGAALANAVAATGGLPSVRRSVLWQPVFDGERFLSQFLRLRIAATLMSQDRKETLAQLREQLGAGQVIEVAGYPITGRLQAGIDAIKPPTVLPVEFGAVSWFEAVREAGAELATPSQQLVDRSLQAGRTIAGATFVGEPYWSATEIVVLPAMVSATVDTLLGAST
jgi:exosortase A-associated hydrolase 2